MRPSRFSAHVRAHDWFAVAVDFVIVVLGVYVAVWVSNQQALRDRQEQTAKVVARGTEEAFQRLAQQFEAADVIRSAPRIYWRRSLD